MNAKSGDKDEIVKLLAVSSGLSRVNSRSFVVLFC